jgi:hypothetical protein
MKNSAYPVLAAVLVLAVSCGGKTVTIEGELAVGGTKGAYQQVSLVRNPGDSLMASIDAVCASERAEIQGRAERIKTLRATSQRFQRTTARTSVAQVMLSDSADKYRQAALDEERAESLRPDTVSSRIAALVRDATDTQVVADNDGRFSFAKRKPGSYVLYVEWLASTGDKEFLARVDGAAGRKKTQNLDQSSVTTKLHCR